jgi:hypothetical protein
MRLMFTSVVMTPPETARATRRMTPMIPLGPMIAALFTASWTTALVSDGFFLRDAQDRTADAVFLYDRSPA